MRHAISVLGFVCFLCFAGVARAEVNYELFPGYGGKQGYPPIASYRAWVLSYRDNKYYNCVASYYLAKPATPKLVCTLGGSFNPPLLHGSNVKTFQALGGPRSGAGTDEALSGFFWQIDQVTGLTQFCMPIGGINCATFQIP